jgi:hypothetical protein
MTTTGYRLIAAITALSAAHHVDHVLRGVTGWPLDGGINAFTYSLLVYPLIAGGVALSRRGRVGARFWAFFAGAGALFIAVLHIGPGAADSVGSIPGQYATPVAGVVALIVLAAFFALLVLHGVYEARRAVRGRR